MDCYSFVGVTLDPMDLININTISVGYVNFNEGAQYINLYGFL